jgi:hypothetical protein
MLSTAQSATRENRRKFMAEVATTKLFENEKIILWEMTLEPGESTGVHTHVRNYVVHILEGSDLEVFDGKGQLLFRRNFAAGMTAAPRFEGKELVDGELRVPATHSAKNVGTTRFREILVETK